MLPNDHAHIIVVGNEKGGVGKTTTSLNIITSLLYDGHIVSAIDLDYRQRSLGTFMQHRAKTIRENHVELPVPTLYLLNKSELDSLDAAKEDEIRRFMECLNQAAYEGDYVVIDAPGQDNYLTRLAHSYADTIVTPINDSFIDFSVLADVNSDTYDVDRSGIYSEMVWEAKKNRIQRDNHPIDWVILRNRLTNIGSHNKQHIARALEKLSKRLGCRVAEGFSERVIYRELYLKGLALLDVLNEKAGISPKVSHIAARQELRNFISFLNLEPEVPSEVDTSDYNSAAFENASMAYSDLNNISLGHLDDAQEKFSVNDLSLNAETVATTEPGKDSPIENEPLVNDTPSQTETEEVINEDQEALLVHQYVDVPDEGNDIPRDTEGSFYTPSVNDTDDLADVSDFSDSQTGTDT